MRGRAHGEESAPGLPSMWGGRVPATKRGAHVTAWTALHKPQMSRLSRRRKNLAATLEIALEPRHAVRRGLLTWRRTPQATPLAVRGARREVPPLLFAPAGPAPEGALPKI